MSDIVVRLRFWGDLYHLHKEAADEIERLRAALAECNSWLNAAIECKNWTWDWDQKEAAIFARDQARAALGEKQ